MGKRKLLTKKEVPSYQLALRCLRFMHTKFGGRAYHENPKYVHALAKEIRAYRNEERKVN